MGDWHFTANVCVNVSGFEWSFPRFCAGGVNFSLQASFCPVRRWCIQFTEKQGEIKFSVRHLGEG